MSTMLVIPCSFAALMQESVFSLLELCCFCGKPTHAAQLSASEIQQNYKQAGDLGCVEGHTAPVAGHREAMDWFVSLCRLFKNTPSCDAQRAALEAGIQLRLPLYKWSGCIDLRFIRSMLSTQVLGGSPHECQYPTSWAMSQWPSDACYWCNCESLQIILPI